MIYPNRALLVFFKMRDITQAILKRPWVVLLVVLGFVGTTLGFTLWQTPVYEASAKLVVVQTQSGAQETDVARGWRQTFYPQEPTLSVAKAIHSRTVAKEAIQWLGLLGMEPSELLDNLAVEQVGSTVFIQLSYRDIDAQRAQQIVNTVAEVSSERMSTNDITVMVLEAALEPTNPVSPDPARNSIVALGLGLMVGIGLALLMQQRAT
jgi:capsular polysaccharide biosynthesis protein